MKKLKYIYRLCRGFCIGFAAAGALTILPMVNKFLQAAFLFSLVVIVSEWVRKNFFNNTKGC